MANGIYTYWEQKRPKPIERILDTLSRNSTAVLDMHIEIETEDAEFRVHFVNDTATIHDGDTVQEYDLSVGRKRFEREFCQNNHLA